MVTLFTNQEFADFNPKYFTYTPSCPGPWSKVVLSADFNITAGIQFDRTAEVSIGYANVYYGTTREDSPTFAPSWHVQRDLTDYSSLFTATQPGEADLGNLVDSTYTGIIYGTAQLLFYPVSTGATAPVVADTVYPMPDAPGGAVGLYTTTDQLTGTFTLPPNVERAYLDVITQSQSDDEFWYTCVPNDVTAELESCGNTAFREGEITIDGVPAGVAPVYPWIYTGGIDPDLWEPIPGVQTLNFVPYRVDLSPFAGILSDGEPHTVGLSVYNADSYFLATATLLVYEDHGSASVTGDITSNTLTAAPDPSVDENLSVDSFGDVTGTVTVSSARPFTIAGYVNTSHGRVDITVNQTVNFSNQQTFDINAFEYVQAISQLTTVDASTTFSSSQGTSTNTKSFTYPLLLDIGEVLQSNGDINLTTTVDQQYITGQNANSMNDEFKGTDTAIFDSNFDFLGNEGQLSSLFLLTKAPTGCSETLVAASNDQVTSKKTLPCN